jgi:Cyclic nucleotide-binding domain
MRSETEAPRASTGLVEALTAKLAGLQLFRGVAREALGALADEVEWLGLPSGCRLFAQGDPADGLYVVLTGRLGVFRTERDGRQRLVSEAVAGDAVGEMALLLGEPRSAGVAALRDSELLRLRAEAFEALLDRYPQLVLQLTRQLAGRLAHGLRPTPPRPGPRTLALLPLGPEPPAAPFARELARALGRLVPRVAVLTAGEADSGSSERLDALERTHDLVLYLAEPGPSPWTRLCLRQADQVLLLDRASRGASRRRNRRCSSCCGAWRRGGWIWPCCSPRARPCRRRPPLGGRPCRSSWCATCGRTVRPTASGSRG